MEKLRSEEQVAQLAFEVEVEIRQQQLPACAFLLSKCPVPLQSSRGMQAPHLPPWQASVGHEICSITHDLCLSQSLVEEQVLWIKASCLGQCRHHSPSSASTAVYQEHAPSGTCVAIS